MANLGELLADKLLVPRSTAHAITLAAKTQQQLEQMCAADGEPISLQDLQQMYPRFGRTMLSGWLFADKSMVLLDSDGIYDPVQGRNHDEIYRGAQIIQYVPSPADVVEPYAIYMGRGRPIYADTLERAYAIVDAKLVAGGK